jgi:hypothetical protein
MNEVFRKISDKDFINDNKQRLKKENLDRVTIPEAVIKVALILLALCFLAIDPTRWLVYFGDNQIVKFSLLAVGFIIFLWVITKFEKDIKGEWVPLHAAIYPRMVYFFYTIFSNQNTIIPARRLKRNDPVFLPWMFWWNT